MAKVRWRGGDAGRTARRLRVIGIVSLVVLLLVDIALIYLALAHGRSGVATVVDESLNAASPFHAAVERQMEPGWVMMSSPLQPVSRGKHQ